MMPSDRLSHRPSRAMLKMADIRRHLMQSTRLDPYLVEVARRAPGHRFLGGAAHGVYLRQVRLLRAALEYRGIDPARARVLDWGSGKGHISYLLRDAGLTVVSCDVLGETDDSSFSQPTPILSEQGFPVVPLEHPWRLPFEDGAFDLVVSFGVLEHVPDDLASLKEIRRVLRSDGLFFFTFLPYWLSWTQRLAHAMGNYYHSRLYRKRTLQSLAAVSGFQLGPVWHGQLLPKNPVPHSNFVEYADRALSFWTPLKYLSTNLEGFLFAS